MAETPSKTPEKPSKADGDKPAKKDFFTSALASITKTIEKWKQDKERKAEALKKSKKPQAAAHQPSGATPTVKINKEVLYNPFGWIKQMFFWSNAQVVLILVTALLVWGLVYLINQRKLVVIDLPKNLEQRVFDTYKQNNYDRDEVERFVINNLVILRSFDFRSGGNLAALQGLVNPDILRKVQESYNANRENIVRTGMIQVLAPPQVNTVFVEEEMVNKNKMVKRAQIYVNGYLMVTTLPKGRSQFTKVIPYRAQLQVLRMPQSRINRSNYYITEITEVAGEEQVKRFDALVQREKEKRGLK